MGTDAALTTKVDDSTCENAQDGLGASAARLPDDAPWTPPALAAQLVRVLASGRADRLSGRYIHAERDDIEELIVHADRVIADDLHAIRLRR